MGNGHLGTHGAHAAKHVEEELRLDTGDVIPLRHMEAAKTVMEKRQNQYDAIQSLALRVRFNR